MGQSDGSQAQVQVVRNPDGMKWKADVNSDCSARRRGGNVRDNPGCPAPGRWHTSAAEAGLAAGAWLGIQGLTITPKIAEAMDLSDDQQGVLVEQVVEDSPADQAGLRGSDQAVDLNGQHIGVGGDIIVAMDDQPVAQMEDLLSVLQGAGPGQEVTLTLVRDGQQVELKVTLGERPTSVP